MSSTAIALPSPKRRVLADVLPHSLLMDIVLVFAGAALTGLLAQWEIPFSPVPMTGQTLGVLLAGASLGAVRGGLSMVVYVAAGLVGMPWFAGAASGYPAATFGYLLGFVVAAFVLGLIAQAGRDRHVSQAIWAMFLAEAIIYAFGVTWLKIDMHLTWAMAVEYGFSPFIVADLVKMLIAALMLPAAWHLIDRMGRNK
jgi:biotin transport system substrate-specific component